MAETITRTTEQWNAISVKSIIIPIGTTCVELITDQVSKIKMGDGKHTFEQLPYIGDEGAYDSMAYQLYQDEHPKNANESNANYIKRLTNGWTDEKKRKYVKRIYAKEMINMETIPTVVQNELSSIQENNNSQFTAINQQLEELSNREYLTTDDLEKFVNTFENEKIHNHENKSILDETTAPFTIELKKKLDELKNFDIGDIEQHTHDNMDVLNSITSDILAMSHTHTNQEILDATTASFTEGYKNQLDNLKIPTYDVFTGATSKTNGSAGLVPAPLMKERNCFLRGDGKWTTIDNVDVDLSNIDAKTVNGHTVQENVPSNAKFTDTTYTASSPLSISHENNISIDLSPYATQTWVSDQIDAIDLSDLDLTQYATKDYVDTAITNIDIPEAFDPAGYATETWVTNQINAIDIPSLDGYATNDYVDTAIATIEPFDPTGYATEAYVDDAIDAIVFPTDATTVNHHTVLSDVPANAIFTDTIYTLPIASDQTLGGVMIGEGLEIANDGVLSVDSSIIPTVPNELGVMELVPKQNEAGILTKTKANNVVEDIDVLQYLNTITLNVGFTS